MTILADEIATCIGVSKAVKKPGSNKPVVLLIHGGGFVEGDETGPEVDRAARVSGMRPVQVHYTLGNVTQAVKDVKEKAREAAKEGRKLVAYGDSAGGTLAALLANKGLVDRAAAFAPVTNLNNLGVLGPKLQEMLRQAGDAKQRRQASLVTKGPSQKPVLVQISANDPLIPPEQTQAWVASDPKLHARMIDSKHGIFPSKAARQAQLTQAMTWLTKRF